MAKVGSEDPTAALLAKENTDVAPTPTSLATYGAVAEQIDADLAKENYAAVATDEKPAEPQHEYEQVCRRMEMHPKPSIQTQPSLPQPTQ
jgi:hypothetical protein